MKRLVVSLIALVFVIVNAGIPSFAAPAPSKALDVSATIDALAPEIDITILQFTDGNPDNNPWTNSTDVTATMSLDFGTLTHSYVDTGGVTRDAGVWYSPAAYCVVIYAQGYGRRYEIRSSCTGIGTISNTYNYFQFSPAYSSLDEFSPGVAQGTRPTGSTLGTAGSAISGTYKLVYRSENPSTGRIIQAYYGIPSRTSSGGVPYSGWTGIPLTQSGGAYSGTVTISVVAI